MISLAITPRGFQFTSESYSGILSCLFVDRQMKYLVPSRAFLWSYKVGARTRHYRLLPVKNRNFVMRDVFQVSSAMFWLSICCSESEMTCLKLRQCLKWSIYNFRFGLRNFIKSAIKMFNLTDTNAYQIFRNVSAIIWLRNVSRMTTPLFLSYRPSVEEELVVRIRMDLI